MSSYYKDQEMKVPTIRIYEPPCNINGCKWWKPEPKFIQVAGIVGQQYAGNILCHAPNMYPDFSCFEPEPKFIQVAGIVGQQYAGNILCHAPNMYPDFSCFEPEPEEIDSHA